MCHVFPKVVPAFQMVTVLNRNYTLIRPKAYHTVVFITAFNDVFLILLSVKYCESIKKCPMNMG